MARQIAALALSGFLAACAGLPVGHRAFLVIGVGVIRVDREANATGIRSISVGARLGCDGLTLGVDSSFCAILPADGNAAILESGNRPDKRLVLAPVSRVR